MEPPTEDKMEQNEAKKKGFIRKFKIGGYSLAFTFWLGFSVYMFTAFATGLLTFKIGIPKVLWDIFIFLPLTIFFLRGLWNSASNSKISTIWIFSAKAFVWVYVALMVGYFYLDYINPLVAGFNPLITRDDL